MRLRVALALGLMLVLGAERALAQGKRVALVVGIGAYENVPRLPNATNDSVAMSDLFRQAGFDVVTARADMGNLAFKRAIREFEDAVVDADIGVVFYAGHGIEVRDVNYLIPTDAKLANERDVEDEAIPLDRLVTALEPAKRLRLIILDACRDNPFASKMRRRVATRSAPTGGLSKVEPQSSDTLIAYAAKDKQVAQDGDGEHSPFTTALLKNLTVPGLDVRLAFGRIRDEVQRATSGQQTPFVYGSLGGGTVALVPAAEQPAAAAGNPMLAAVAQKTDYEIVERVGRKEAWEVFLNTHKTGLYADLARVQLAKLTTTDADGTVRSTSPGAPADAPVRVTPRVDAPAVAPVPKPTAEESRAWERLRNSADRAGIRKFLEKYPSSPLAPPAQERLDLLDRQAREREDALVAEREVARARAEEEARVKAAEIERKRLEQEVAQRRAAEAKAKAAEAERQRAEALAAQRQKEAEERARIAEAAARQKEAEERARLVAETERRRQAEERARLAEEARLEGVRQAAERRRIAEDEARAAAARAKLEAAETAKAVAAARETAEREAAAAQAKVDEAARLAEAERLKVEQDVAARQAQDEAVRKTAEAERRKVEAAAEAERRKASEAAQAAARLKREREMAEQRREAAEEARRVADRNAAASRRQAAEASRRAAERQAEKAAAVAEKRKREARQAREIAQQARPRVAAPAAAPRARVEASRPAAAPARSGGGAASMVGIGF